MKYCLIDHAWENPDIEPRFEVVESVPGLKNVRFRGSWGGALSSAKLLSISFKATYKIRCSKPIRKEATLD